MNQGRNASEQEAFIRTVTLWLERLTALVLLLVLVAVVWMVGVAVQPEWLRLSSPEMEAMIVLVLLTTALILVSVVALLHTRKSGSC